jgi:hypothetical protein
MKPTQEIKLMIIQNFITHLGLDRTKEGKEMYNDISIQYVTEDHVDEIAQGMLDAHEVGLVATILTDNLLERFGNDFGHKVGYIERVETITEWAEEFVKKFAFVVEWDAFNDSDANPYKGKTTGWEDIIVAFGKENLNNLYI